MPNTPLNKEELREHLAESLIRYDHSRMAPGGDAVDIEVNTIDEMMVHIEEYCDAAVREARIDTAKHIQGHLMADEPKVIASRRTEDQDNTWFTAQLTFSNYISDDVIDPYIAALQSQPNAKEEER